MYKEVEKVEVRKRIFSYATEILTYDRNKSCISNIDSINKIRKFLANDSSHNSDKWLNEQLEDEDLKDWEHFHQSLLGEKKINQLKVAYLAGPNPENDLEELIRHGILQENVWAFESDTDFYKKAIENLMSKYPKVKIHKGSIGNFFENSPLKFDIIYLDFCSPIFNRGTKSKNISTLMSLIKNHAINSPGVLITNFSLPTETQDPVGRELLAKLISLYLYPKSFLEKSDGALTEGYSISKWVEKVGGDLEFYYSQFISRLIMDISSVIIPFNKFVSNGNYFDRYFKLERKKFKDIINELYYVPQWQEKDINEWNENIPSYMVTGGCVHADTDFFSIPWTLMMMDKTYQVFKDEEKKIFNDTFNKYTGPFLSQLSGGSDKELDNIRVMYYLLFAQSECTKYYSEELKCLYNVNWRKIAPQFCDPFTFESIIGLLIGQLTVPYHVNVKKSKKYKYKAKDTLMFTDIYILDECRYIYDMMPTMDMLLNRLDNRSSQLCYRFALNELNRNQYRYNEELFYGNAVVGINHSGFEESIFEDVEDINKYLQGR